MQNNSSEINGQSPQSSQIDTGGQQMMKEQKSNRIEINNKQITAEVFRTMLKWIYTGECELSENPMEVVPLLGLTDEYLLQDLQRVCEDQIIDYMDGKSAAELLTDQTITLPVMSEQNIKEAAKTCFLDDYDRLLQEDPEIEVKVCQVKGLMSELFTHKKKKVKSVRRRRVSFNDDTSRKKVRFNISSTVYEDNASAMADDSVSVIEPLSIYSNVSPPGELADVSLPHSAFSVQQQVMYQNSSTPN